MIATPAENAFQRAKESLAKSPLAEKFDVFGQTDSILSVQDALQSAQARYQDRPRCKARKWLIRLSSRIMHYSAILDVFAQYHPEYAAIPWGTFKLLFVSVLTHETSLKELAKALCRIASALPSVDRNLFLYSSPAMDGLVVDLYVNIMEFACRAIRWYDSGPWKHIVDAFARPFALKFKDIVENIDDIVRSVKELALDLRGEEIRRISQAQKEMNDKLLVLERASQGSQRLMEEIKKMMGEFHQLQHMGMLDTSKQVCEVKISHLMSFASSTALADPSTCRQKYASKRNFRRRYGQSDSASLSQAKQLQQWSAGPQSAQLAVLATAKSREVLQDFVVDAIEVVQSAGVPVVWALPLKTNSSQPVTSTEVLKHLVSQLLKQNESLQSERAASLNAVRFQSATSEHEWYQLLGSILEGLPQVYVFIDIGVLDEDLDPERPWLEGFQRVFDDLAMRSVMTTLKVAFLSSNRSQRTHLGTVSRDKILDISKVQLARVQRARPSYARNVGRRGNLKRLEASIKASRS